MKRQTSYIIIASIFLSAVVTSCEKEKDVEKVMTMTSSISGEVTISLAGTGSATIDWGDGSTSDTQDLLSTASTLYTSIVFEHNYSETNTRKIRIYGDNITGLNCAALQLTNLDVSRNTVLKRLCCSNNQLTSLDVSNNTALILLECGQNQLTSLNMSKTAALTLLDCSYNQLTNLDVSNNNALTVLFCSTNQLTNLNMKYNSVLRTLDCGDNKLMSLDLSGSVMLLKLYCVTNQLSTDALHTLFGTLHSDFIEEGKAIFISNNPGTDYCDPFIASNKGWTVHK